MAYELIETITLASSVSSIEFTSIPQDGVDLLLKVSLRSFVDYSDLANVRVNSDSGSNYSGIRLRGNGSSADSSSWTSNTEAFIPMSHKLDTSSTFGNGQIYFSNYAGSSNKSFAIDAVSENNATTAQQQIYAWTYLQTTAITSIQLIMPSGNFALNTTASLYKIS